MNAFVTVTPANGRTYKNQKAIRADYEAGKDFILQDFSSLWDGKPVNREDFEREGVTQVNVRYQQMRKVCAIKVGGK